MVVAVLFRGRVIWSLDFCLLDVVLCHQAAH